MAGVRNYLDFDIAKINNIVYKDTASQEKNVNISEHILNHEIDIWNLQDIFKGRKFDAEVVLGFNGKEYKSKNSISLLPE